MSNSNQSLIFFISEVSCFIKVRTTSTLFSGMFWLGCYSCSCCGGNRIKSTPCSQTWTRTRTKQQLFLIFPYPYSKRLKPNWESTKRGIQDPKEGFAKWRRFHQKISLFVASSWTIRKKIPQLLLCIILTRIFYRFLFPNHHVLCLQEFLFAFYCQIWESLGIYHVVIW